jgi:hypothetical protein
MAGAIATETGGRRNGKPSRDMMSRMSKCTHDFAAHAAIEFAVVSGPRAIETAGRN